LSDSFNQVFGAARGSRPWSIDGASAGSLLAHLLPKSSAHRRLLLITGGDFWQRSKVGILLGKNTMAASGSFAYYQTGQSHNRLQALDALEGPYEPIHQTQSFSDQIPAFQQADKRLVTAEALLSVHEEPRLLFIDDLRLFVVGQSPLPIVEKLYKAAVKHGNQLAISMPESSVALRALTARNLHLTSQGNIIRCTLQGEPYNPVNLVFDETEAHVEL
jgi:hypothetical protein